jgi:hypothetical protein
MPGPVYEDYLVDVKQSRITINDDGEETLIQELARKDAQPHIYQRK